MRFKQLLNSNFLDPNMICNLIIPIKLKGDMLIVCDKIRSRITFILIGVPYTRNTIQFIQIRFNILSICHGNAGIMII